MLTRYVPPSAPTSGALLEWSAPCPTCGELTIWRQYRPFGTDDRSASAVPLCECR